MVLMVDITNPDHFTGGYFSSSSDIAVIVFDVTRNESFSSARCFLKTIRTAFPMAVVVSVGINIELSDCRYVSKEDAEEFFKQNEVSYFEASTKTGDGINDVFLGALRDWAVSPQNGKVVEEKEQEQKSTEQPEDKGCVIC